MKDVLVSIIIPVYNIAPWVVRCLESIAPLLGEDTEAVVVVGPSADGSNEACAAWAARRQWARVVVQQGRGLADARNCGVCASRGQFLLYLDGDDFVDTAQLQWLLGRLRTLDAGVHVVMTDYYMTDSAGQTVAVIDQLGPQTVFSTDQTVLLRALRRRKCFWNVWRYVYRRAFLEANAITFAEDTFSEDMDYTAQVFAAQPVFAFAHCPFYRYCVGRGDSLMDRPTLRRLEDTLCHIQRGVAMLDGSPAPYAPSFIAQYQFEYLLNTALCVEIPREDRSAAYGLYRRTRAVLRVGRDPVARPFYGLFCILPVPLLAWGFHIIKRIKRLVKGNLRPSNTT